VKKKYASPKLKQRAYMERKQQKQEAAVESADVNEQGAKWDLRFFGESAYNRNAESLYEEIHVHRQFLRALSQPDVLPGGETLRQLAKRTWDALLKFKDTSPSGGKWIEQKWTEGEDAWIPLFNPRNQQFDGGPTWQGCVVPGAARPDWFDAHWVPPGDCTGDESISIDGLPNLPPIGPVTGYVEP
jgi:hypothetical protein